MPGPRAGNPTPSALEKYVIPQITAAPTNTPEQYGVEPGFPEPDAANQGDARLGVAGKYRSTNVPTVEVKVMDLGVSSPGYAGQINQALRGDDITIDQIVGGVGKNLSGKNTVLPIARIGVKRTDNTGFSDDADYVALTRDFSAFGSDFPAAPTGAGGTWNVVDCAPLLAAPDGTLRLFILSKCDDASLFGLEAKWLDPAQHTSFQTFYTNTNLQASLPGGERTSTITNIAAFVFEDQIYIALNAVNLTSSGRFHLFRIRGEVGSDTNPPILEAIKDYSGTPVTVAPNEMLGGIGGIAGCGTQQGMIIAQGLATIWGGDGSFRTVGVQRSPDGQRWGQTQSYAAQSGVTISTVTVDATDYTAIKDTGYPSSSPGFPPAARGDVITLGSGFTEANKKSLTIVSWAPGQINVAYGFLTNETPSGAVSLTIRSSSFESLSDYAPVKLEDPIGAGEKITSIHFANTQEGIAGTDQGRLYRTLDAGRTWEKEYSPAEAANTSTRRATPIRSVFCLPTAELYSATTIAFVSSTKRLTDSDNSMPVCGAKDLIVVKGSTAGNDQIFTVASRAAGYITVNEALTDESAGKLISIRVIPWCWACGDNGLMMRFPSAAPQGTSDTAGADTPDWRVWRGLQQDTYQSSDRDYTYNSTPSLGFGSNSIRCQFWTDRVTGYVSGTGGFIGRIWNVDARANHQYLIRTASAQGAFLGMAYDSANRDTLWLVGQNGVNRTKNNATADFNKRILRVKYASDLHVANFSSNWAVFDLSNRFDLDAALVGVSLVSSSLAFAVDSDGFVIKWNGTAWSVVSRLPPGTPACIQALDSDTIIVGGNDSVGGLIWRSIDGGATWLIERVASGISSIHFFDEENASVGGLGALATCDSFGDNRTYPALITLRSGAVLLAVANSTKARIEVFRAEGQNTPFTLVWNSGDVPLSTTGSAWSPSTDWIVGTQWPRPSFTQDDSNAVLLAVGQEGYVSTDDGRFFKPRAHESLALPLGRLSPQGSFLKANINKSRQLCAFGGGRLFSSMVTTTSVRVTVARDWSASGNDYMPVIPGVRQWLGIDDGRLVWNGIPVPGDRWRIDARFRYPARHVVIPSPSITARTADNASDWVFEWDSYIILGPGRLFNINGAAWFGGNFRKGTLRTSVPSYPGDTFPTLATDYVEYAISSDVESFGIDYPQVAPGILPLINGDLVSDQYAPALRTWYAAISGNGSRNLHTSGTTRIVTTTSEAFAAIEVGAYITANGITRKVTGKADDNGIVVDTAVNWSNGGTGYAWTYRLPAKKITGNLSNRLLIENESALVTNNRGTVQIFSDRCFDPMNAGILSGEMDPIDAGATDYRFCRFVRVIIPAESTAGQYIWGDQRILGYLLLGTYVDYAPYAGTDARRRHQGMTWQAADSSITTKGLSGVSTTERFGRPQQKWTLPYDVAQWWDRDMRANGLMPHLLLPFGLVFDGADPQSIELVRLSDSPQSQNVFHDRWTETYQLEEVL